MELSIAPLFHVYEEAPLAVNVADWPEHIVALFTVTFGAALTVTCAEAGVDVQPEVVPVTV